MPEFPASKIKFFLNLNPFKPTPLISQKFFDIFIFTPSFLRHFKVLMTSSESNKFTDLDLDFDCDAISAHLIDKLLSPSIDRTLLNFWILSLIFIRCILIS